MAKFKKKPVVIEAITFAELVQHGKDNGGNIVNGMPWSFEYKGHGITHENDQTYLIPTPEGIMKFTADDMLITDVNGEIYPCKLDIFDKTYEPVSGETKGFTFGEALELMKKGYRVSRDGWNGKGMYLVYIGGGVANHPLVEGGVEVESLHSIAMWTVNSSGRKALLNGWAPSQTDMLANDWVWLNRPVSE